MKIDSTYDDLTPEVGHILRVDVTPDRPKQVRHREVLANHLSVTIDGESSTEQTDASEPSDDDEEAAQTSTEANQSESLKGTKGGTGYLQLKQATGDGSLWLGRQGGDITVIAIDGPIVLVSQAELLATDGTIVTHLSTEIPDALGNTTGASRVWELHGTGHVAFATNGMPVAINLTEDEPLRIEANALLAYDTTVSIEEADDHNKQLRRRDAETLANKGNSENTRVWIRAGGNGTVLVTNQAS